MVLQLYKNKTSTYSCKTEHFWYCAIIILLYTIITIIIAIILSYTIISKAWQWESAKGPFSVYISGLSQFFTINIFMFNKNRSDNITHWLNIRGRLHDSKDTALFLGPQQCLGGAHVHGTPSHEHFKKYQFVSSSWQPCEVVLVTSHFAYKEAGAQRDW